jgi:glycosyltransferase involved in cell wall biosynthesis
MMFLAPEANIKITMDNRKCCPVGVSVVVCCYNSANRLPNTLKYISEQVVQPGITWEVIVIDNNSSDNTAAVAHQLWLEYNGNPSFTIVNQPVPGLNNAREKGFEFASYEYIILCDDDNWLASDYVENAYTIMQQHPEVGIAGGRSEPVCEVEPPDWFGAQQSSYAVGWQALHSGDLTSTRKYVWGAGMVLRKSVWLKLKKAGFKSLVSDRIGDKLTSGGDSELCYAFILAGYRIWYDDALVFKHFIPKERLTFSYLNKMRFDSIPAYVNLDAYRHIIDGTCFKDGRLKSLIWLRVSYQSVRFLSKAGMARLKNLLKGKKQDNLDDAFYGELIRLKYILLSNLKYDAYLNSLLNLKSEFNKEL